MTRTSATSSRRPRGRPRQLTGLDLSPATLAQARDRASGLGRHVDQRLGEAQLLDFPDANFDAAVATLAQCRIPDEHAADAEMTRALPPRGHLVLREHVASPNGVMRGV
ncbi:class I SAM-dependent methyltransferase [Segeticoccus rhizosphaerae]|uniref:class I SAM-dependent methyltransferase n=1 Tax=Segeticoccus rhizosphaerae TaxID=1104777 RepID=UPI00139046D2